MPLAYLINIVESTLVYRLHSCDISYWYFCRIYNDINYCCYAICQHAFVCVYAIVTVAALFKTSQLLEYIRLSQVKHQSVTILIYSINSCCHFCHSKLISAVFIVLYFCMEFPIACSKNNSKYFFITRVWSTFRQRHILEAAIGVRVCVYVCVIMNGAKYNM